MNNKTERTIEILVFKTNITTEEDLAMISLLFADKALFHCWTVDREDADKVLRIQTKNIAPSEIIQLTRDAGFFCEELPD